MLDFAHAGKSLSETLLEESFCLLLVASKTIRRCHQLLSFGREQCTEETGIDHAERTPQPHIEEIREVSVADIVVVWRIRADKRLTYSINSRGRHQPAWPCPSGPAEWTSPRALPIPQLHSSLPWSR